jgi:hypothetical protein
MRLVASLFEVLHVVARSDADPVQRRQARTDTQRAASAHQHLAIPMHLHHYRDLIVRAVHAADGKVLEQLVAQLSDAARAREILRAKGYGLTGMSASATAAQVPINHNGEQDG